MVLQLYLNSQAGGTNAPLTFTATNLQTNQQFVSGVGYWSDASHIETTYRMPNGVQSTGRWHVNHMPSGGYPQQPSNAFPTPPPNNNDVYPGASSMQTPSKNGNKPPL